MGLDAWLKKVEVKPSPCATCIHSGAGLPPNVEVDEVEQYDIEEDYPCVPVDVKNIVAIRSLPAKRGTMGSAMMDVNKQNIVHVASPDPRVRRLVVVATGAAWLDIPANLQAPNGPYGFFLPANVPVVFEGIHDEIWALAGDNTASPHISWREEFWAD